MKKHRLGFIGFGQMAEIIWKGIARKKLIPPSQVFFVRKDQDKQKQTAKDYGIIPSTISDVVSKCDIILICILPQIVEDILKEFPMEKFHSKFFISILAGTKISFFQKFLGKNVQILRVMPNFPSIIGEGMNALSWDPNLTKENIRIGKLIFSSMGEVEQIPETLMDAVVGIAGSCPAFVWKFIDIIARQGEKEGFSYAQALKFTAQTFVGSSKLILQGQLPSHLIKKMSLPNGTTVAGLEVFKKSQIEKEIQQVISTSIKRSKELS